MYDKSLATILDYHRSMVTDRRRVDALQRAIAVTVRPGDVVLDIGCGTGLLSFFACQAGAAQVIAVDSGEVIELARQLGREHRFDDRIRWLRMRSQDLELESRADVLISETLGNGGFDEGILGTVLDARNRLLVPDAAIIPQGVSLRLCALDDPAVSTDLDAWPRDLHGLDYTTLRPLAANQLAWQRLRPESLISEAASLPHLDLSQHTEPDYGGHGQLTPTREATLRALGVWFHSRLTTEITLHNDPVDGARSWCQAVLPIAEPLAVHPGDRLDVHLDIQADGSLWTWRCELHPADGGPAKERQQSTFLGTFLSPESLHRRAADFRPELSDDGRVELAILRSMDGEHSLSEIAERMMAEHPGRLPSRRRALAVVREVVRRLGR